MAAFEVIALDTATPQLRAPGASDTYTFPRAVEMPLGTANGVLFLNGSNVMTTGSALSFNGGTLSANAACVIQVLRADNARGGSFYADNTGTHLTALASGNDPLLLEALGAGDIRFRINNSEQMRLTSTGLGIGTSSPTNKLTVDGNANITGNTTLGDASTDTVQVNGYMGVGGTNNARLLSLTGSGGFAGTTQIGVSSLPTGTSAGTVALIGASVLLTTATAAYTVSDVINFAAYGATKGAGSTITNLHGLYIADQTQGTNNYGITSQVSSGSNKWNIYASGTAANYFAGDVGVGNTSITDFSGRVLAVHAVSGNAARIKLTTATSGTASTDGGGIVYDTSNVLQLINRQSDGVISLATNAIERLRIKSTGQLRYVPLGGDPGGAENGDVYYNSTTNKLRLYAAGAWVDLN